MREIKFRQLVTANDGIKFWHYWGILGDGIYAAPAPVLHSTESQQYTGLKDKNGKEIYEGDIVVSFGNKYVISFGWGDDNEGYGKSYGWLKGGLGWDRIFGHHEDKDMEVIGNIHEDPEFLN